MIRPTEIFIESLPFVEDDSDNKRFYFDPCNGFVTVHLFQNVLFILIFFDIQAVNSQSLHSQFSPPQIQSKTQHLLTSIQFKNFSLL